MMTARTRYVSSAEAAAMLGVSVRRVRALAAGRRLPGARLVGRDWRIPVMDGGMIAVAPGTRGPRPAADPRPVGP